MMPSLSSHLPTSHPHIVKCPPFSLSPHPPHPHVYLNSFPQRRGACLPPPPPPLSTTTGGCLFTCCFSLPAKLLFLLLLVQSSVIGAYRALPISSSQSSGQSGVHPQLLPIINSPHVCRLR